MAQFNKNVYTRLTQPRVKKCSWLISSITPKSGRLLAGQPLASWTTSEIHSNFQVYKFIHCWLFLYSWLWRKCLIIKM